MQKDINCLKIYVNENVNEDQITEFKDKVVEEKALSLFINGRNYTTAMISPHMQKEFVLGHLFSEGIIKELDEVESIQIQENTAKVLTKSPLQVLIAKKTIVSGCGGGSSFLDESKLPKIDSNFKISKDSIFKAVKSVLTSEIHKTTYGIHSCGLFGSESLICKVDDIGRHNALDKTIGYALSKGCDFSETFAVTTGRISSEMVLKCSMANIPIIASRGATTSLAIDIADKTGLTILGFVRGKKMSVYSGGQKRLIF